FPDGLCGGALAYQLHAPVILIKDGKTSYAKQFVENEEIRKGIVLGGSGALADALVNGIFNRVSDAPIEPY
ncbi:MAG: cell wall-binding repeat-containing protein, partial [Erysipelotrichaceae bacterium]|nr:cell wall-binding repeat-containing protein [Erysipelotrichaceae bacterium]